MDGMPEDVRRLLSDAYAHKVRVGYHRRRLREAMVQLQQRCDALGIPVPQLDSSQGPRRRSDRTDEHP